MLRPAGHRDDFLGCPGDGRDGFTGQRDAAPDLALLVVVEQFQAECFEELAGYLVGHVRQVDGGDGKLIEQAGVDGLGLLFFERGEFGLQPGAFGAQLRAAGVDVPDEFLVRVLDQLEVAEQPFAADFGLGDLAADGRDLLLPLALAGLSEFAVGGLEDLVPVLAEDPGGEEF